MANLWMHNGFVRVDDEKMSKSLGNFFTIRTVLEQYDAEVVRFFILRAHYRSPLNYSDQHLDDAKSSLTRLYTALRGHEVAVEDVNWQHPQAVRFKAAMDDDFNTPEAIAVLFDLANDVNKTQNASTAGLLKSLGAIVGLLQRDANGFLQGRRHYNLEAESGSYTLSGSDAELIVNQYTTEKIDSLIQTRIQAKKDKDFAEADRIRAELSDAGIVLEDTAQGTTWRKA